MESHFDRMVEKMYQKELLRSDNEVTLNGVNIPRDEIKAAINALSITESGRDRCKNLINALKQYL